MSDSTAPTIVIALAALTAVALTFMGLRFFCKARYHKKFGWDDYILASAWILLLTYMSLTIASCQYGIGHHLADIPAEDLTTGLELLYIARFFAIIALAISKSSFAVTLLHFALETWQRYVIWFVIISLNITMWFCGLSLFVQCNPVRKGWDTATPGTCWDTRITVDIGIFAGAYSAAMDFTLSLFPSMLIWKLRISKKEKIGVIIAMSLGVLAGITAIIKTTYIKGSGKNLDYTYTTANLLIWSGSESAVTISAASIPFLRLMIKEVSNSGRPYAEDYGLGPISGRNVVIESDRTRKSRRNDDRRSDRSDRSIFGDDVPGNGIMQTDEVVIEYEGADKMQEESRIAALDGSNAVSLSLHSQGFTSGGIWQGT